MDTWTYLSTLTGTTRAAIRAICHEHRCSDPRLAIDPPDEPGVCIVVTTGHRTDLFDLIALEEAIADLLDRAVVVLPSRSRSGHLAERVAVPL